MNRLKWGAVICSLMLAACAGIRTAKLYDGPELSVDRVAFVTVDMFLSVHAVDNVEAHYNAMTKLAVLPGQHTISLGYGDGNSKSTGLQTLPFSVEAGKTYKFNAWRNGRTWGASVVEVGTNK